MNRNAPEVVTTPCAASVIWLVGGALLALVGLSSPANSESLYVMNTFAIVRADLNGSNAEVVRAEENPNCTMIDFEVDPEGFVYFVVGCHQPILTFLYRFEGKNATETLASWNGFPTPRVTSIKLDDGRPWLFTAYLTLSSESEIQLMRFDEDSTTTVVTGAGIIAGLDFDSTTQKLYWAQDRGPGRIMRADRGEGNVEAFATGLRRPVDVWVDGKNGMVYWVDTDAGKIQRAPRTDGQSVETVLADLDSPAGIAIHEASGKLYWTELGSNRVRRSNLDGSMVEDVMSIWKPGRIAFGPEVVAVEQKTWTQIKTIFRE